MQLIHRAGSVCVGMMVAHTHKKLPVNDYFSSVTSKFSSSRGIGRIEAHSASLSGIPVPWEKAGRPYYHAKTLVEYADAIAKTST